MKNKLLCSILSIFVLISIIKAQNTTSNQSSNSDDTKISISPTTISTGTYYGLTPPLRDIPAITEEELLQISLDNFTPNKDEKKGNKFPFEETDLLRVTDPALQSSMGIKKIKSGSIQLNVDGTSTSIGVSDCNGAIGPNHYMQTLNVTYTIFDRSGNIVAGPTNMNQLFGSVPGANCNDGDPIILYDEQAQRWMAAEFSLCQPPNHRMLIAISTTDDPTGTWHQYSFVVANTPDYEKFGIWKDAYYMGTNTGYGTDIYAFERSKMLVGDTAQMIAFDNSWKPNVGGVTVPPLDNDGAFAPDGSPGLFIAANDDAWGGSTDQLWIYEFIADWDSPSNSSFSRVQQIDVGSFNSFLGSGWNNITQPGTSQKLDGIVGYIMNRPQYRNFGTYETIICCHTVDADLNEHAGIRWYELRRIGGGDWTVRQEGTYAPDNHSRWMASIVLNGYNEIGVGYSISSNTEYPGLRVTGQTADEYANATGILNVAEDTVIVGTQSQTNGNRWGDYFNTSIDPVDDKTFWFSGEYRSGSLKKTKIVNFSFPILLNSAFNANNTIACVGDDITFTDISAGNIEIWSWSFPGGTPDSFNGQTPPPIVYNSVGFFDVSLTVTDSANDSNTFTIDNYVSVYEIFADFSSDTTTIFVGNAINFTDNSLCSPDDWEWTFNGGTPNTFSGQNPPPIVYDTFGSYDVSLIVTSTEGTNTILKNDFINVIKSLPEACISAFPLSGDAPLSVSFNDCSSNDPISWVWDFGDGDSSIEQNPIHIYANQGTYTVSLIVANETGNDTIVQDDYIVTFYTDVKIKSKLDEIKIIPNPTTGKITISPVNNAKINIYNIASELVFTKENVFGVCRVDLSNLESGVYIIEIIENGTAIQKKVSMIKK